MDYDVANLDLAPEGKKKIEWAEREMPVLAGIASEWQKNKPLQGLKIAACLHVTSETAVLMNALATGGAEIRLCASNPLSTQDDVAASLVKDYHIGVYAIRAENRDTYYRHINDALAIHPQVTMDDGADLVFTLRKSAETSISQVIGGTEETTTGVIRLKSMAKENQLQYPIIAVNDAQTKYLFDNRYGTGQSTFEGILRSTHTLIAGKKVVVAGYGWCGRGVALRARGLGARVAVTEVEPIKALEALMDGNEVMPMDKAASWGDLFVTVTGNISVIRREHFLAMHDGAVLANAGHFNVEIDIDELEKLCVNKREVRPLVNEYTLPTGTKISLLGEGRLVNLACAEGHPALVMDMSFANQALSVAYIKERAGHLRNTIYPVPEEIDRKVAYLKLESLGARIDMLTPRQEKYLASWEEGT
ncbi:MAG TPA: adenosylhomocysteinase [Atribacteraceae bacterium]|nr:adenosylhomocysteinase [Atribacteraceae bacterium]